ncbi:asparagine synthase-related protein [Streptomyces sp. NPDC050617]|uniref:asparagine synthase-related protein n=1 Tax=Streptomyces sp. NPDC050617 TaxID=3154628 RepID=UPI003446D7DE
MSNTASGCWFVVLPDAEFPPGLLARLRGRAADEVDHPSGRPWLLGSWAAEDMALARAGGRLLALFGEASASAAVLRVRLKKVRGLTDLEGALAGVYGSFHVAASLAGHGYVRGSASGARRLYRADIGGVTVCADRARTLAWLIGARPDTARVAAHLAFPQLPHPLAGASMWTGVEAVSPGDALCTEPDGRGRTAGWWQAPPAELPLDEGARALRDALREAVALRVRPGQVLGADLSGGMDSTSLCFLAAESGASLVTATLHWSAPGNEDREYARYAAERLPGAEPLEFVPEDLPACFTGLDEPRHPLEEPNCLLRDRAVQQRLAGELRSWGAVLRLSGHGGDHVVVPPVSYLHTLLRRSPRAALRQTAGFKARGRWPLAATARMLLGHRSYPAWLTTARSRLREAAPTGGAPEVWGPYPRLPVWASAQTAEQFAALLGQAAERDLPLAAEPGRHAWIHQMREAGRVATLLHEAGAEAGLPTHSPFCDDAVLDACLAVRPEDAGSPWSYKPLLAAAMDGLVPERLLDRTSKDHCSAEWHRGLKTHRRHLAAWADTSLLTAAGITDPHALRQALLSPGLNTGGAAELESTLGAEAWLREVAAHPEPAYLAPRHHQEEPSVDTAAH